MRFKYIHLLAALFLIVGMGVQSIASYRQAKRYMQERMELEMQIAQEKLLFELYDAYEAEEQMESAVAENLSTPENLLEVTRSFIKRYPNIYTCYVSFPEYRYPEKGRWYCPSSYRVRDTIISDEFGDEEHDYFTREWYRGALMSERTKGYWSQPYKDEDFDETIYTYSNDMRDRNDSLVCIIGLDFSLNWMHQLLERFKPFDDVVFEVYSSNGTLLTSSEKADSSRKAKDRKSGIFDEHSWMVSHRTIQPLDIDMVIAVPRKYIWESIRLGILLSFGVFLMGILSVGLLIRRMWRDSNENLRLETEKEVMSHELHIAHGIQMDILNHCFPNDDNIELRAVLLPMREVGGDLYDFHHDGDDLWFIIGDVSGKGVPAAMVMAATVNLFRASGRRQNSPKAIMEEMNAVLSDNNPSLTFVTAFIGHLHIPSGQLMYCNAGHCQPICVANAKNGDMQSDDCHSRLSILPIEPNIPLGYDGKYRFVEQGCMLGEDEMLVLYTDGVTEARNTERKMLGLERWMKLVAQNDNLLEAVKRYIGKAEPTDDITLMTIRKRGAVQPMTLRVPNNDKQWAVLRRAIHSYGLCAGMQTRHLKKLEVAAEEAVANILHYSGATEIAMELSVLLSHPGIRLTFTDDGIPFDPTAYVKDTAKNIEERQIGGLGISLIRQIADELHYQRIGNTNQLILIKHI